MSDTITITPEERARLRGILSEHGNGQVEDRIILRLLNALEHAEARAEKAEAENARQIMVSKALARKLAQATRTWGKAGNMDNSAGYWLAWAEHDADAEIKAARRAVADSEVKG